MKALEDTVGKSIGEGTWGEEEYEAVFEGKWAPGKQCVLVTGTARIGSEKYMLNGVVGWDSATGEVVHWSHVAPDAGIEIVRYKPGNGEQFIGTISYCSATTTSKSKVILEIGKEVTTFRITDRIVDGEKQSSDVVLTFRKK
jgi:hypothetical protein